MNEYNSIEIDETNLHWSDKVQVNEITKTENYFNTKINQRKWCSLKLRKYVTTFDHIDKVWIVLSATSGGISIISFTGIVEAPVGIARVIFTLIFFCNNDFNWLRNTLF